MSPEARPRSKGGGGVVNSLLENKSGASASEKAKDLSARGFDLVQADGIVEDQMVKACKGTWADSQHQLR